MSPLQKQTGHQIYRQLQSPPSDSALKNMLAGAALSKLSQMSAVTDYIMNEVTDSEGAYEANDRNKRSNSAKLCGMQDCKKRAKAGGYCIAHGGGLRCAEKGCQKHAVSLGLCISHGGGKRCTVERCVLEPRRQAAVQARRLQQGPKVGRLLLVPRWQDEEVDIFLHLDSRVFNWHSHRHTCSVFLQLTTASLFIDLQFSMHF
jgi:hypothetical protein